MKEYEILEHKADLKIKAFGKTKEELFLNMMIGMTESQKPEIEEGVRVKREIRIQSLDLSSLLVDFLSEILSLGQINKETYKEISFRKFSDPSTGSGQVAELEAEIFGQKVEKFGEDIKAITYHQLDVHQREDGIWEGIVLFDV
jgi:SHS2 domain-containing protein